MLGISICYEDAFARDVLRTMPDATLLVNISNDAWFGRSAAAEQHLQLAQMRAIETGRPMLRANNTGITAVIDDKGRVTQRLEPWTEGILEATVHGRTGATPYAMWGDLPILLISHNGSSSVKDLINPPAGTVNDGVANYASQLKGLIHIIGGVAAQTSGNAECNLGESATIQGTVILNQDVRFNTNVATFAWDPNLYLNPPVGYSTGPTVKIAPGSAQWEAGP